MADSLLYMNPAESISYEVDFADVLPSADSALSNVGASDSTIEAVSYAGTDVGSTILSSKTRTGKKLSVVIGSLTLGEEYTITFKGEGATSTQKFVKTLRVLCRSNIGGSF
jgi:hypothetical protein